MKTIPDTNARSLIPLMILYFILTCPIFSKEEKDKNGIWKMLDCSDPSWSLEYVLYKNGMIIKYEFAKPYIGYPAMNGNLFQIKVGKWDLDGETVKVYFTGEKWKSWRRSNVSNASNGKTWGYFHYESFLKEIDKLKFFDKLNELKAGNYLTDDITVDDKWPGFEKKFIPTKTAHD